MENSAILPHVASCSFSHERRHASSKSNSGQTWSLHSLPNDGPYYIGKTGKPLIKRLKSHALKPNARRYNFWNYFSAFEITNSSHRDEVEAILISAMPTAANGARPKIPRMPLDRAAAKLLNTVQALMLTGRGDTSGESTPEGTDDEDD